MIDAVITWVDGNDSEHKRKRKLFLDAEKVGDPEAIAATRFSSNGELPYCIRLIRKNAPWINNIYLITDAQCPSWLDEGQKAKLGVTVVDHKKIFRGYEEVLPTFNSLAIETIMYRIPDLSDRFIYFNDDVFIIKPVLETDYFLGSVPLIRGFSFSKNKLLRELHRLIKPKSFRMKGVVGTGYRQEDGLNLAQKVKIFHTPHPINRQDYADLMEGNNRLERNIRSKFRNSSQFGPVPLYTSAGLDSGRVRIVPRDDLYLDPKIEETIDRTVINSKASAHGIRHMCVQSLDNFGVESQRNIYELLDRLIAT